MAQGIVSKEKIRTIIVTASSEFRQKAVQMLNNIAYPAEKLSADAYDQIAVQFGSDERMGNLVIDATCAAGQGVAKRSAELVALLGRHHGLALIYCEASTLEEWRGNKAFNSPLVKIECQPQSRDHYAGIFHTRGATKSAIQARTPVRPTSDAAKAKDRANKPAEAKPEVKLEKPAPPTSVIEAGQHVKECVAKLKTLSHDPSNLPLLAEVGQRFNGVVGTFAFFNDRPGFAEMRQLAFIIDCLCRTYQAKGQDKPQASIEVPHLALLMRAAKTYYDMLTRMLKNDGPLAEQTAGAGQLTAEFQADSTIVKPDMQSQNAVDALLGDLGVA